MYVHDEKRRQLPKDGDGVPRGFRKQLPVPTGLPPHKPREREELHTQSMETGVTANKHHVCKYSHVVAGDSIAFTTTKPESADPHTRAFTYSEMLARVARRVLVHRSAMMVVARVLPTTWERKITPHTQHRQQQQQQQRRRRWRRRRWRWRRRRRRRRQQHQLQQQQSQQQHRQAREAPKPFREPLTLAKWKSTTHSHARACTHTQTNKTNTTHSHAHARTHTHTHTHQLVDWAEQLQHVGCRPDDDLHSLQIIVVRTHGLVHPADQIHSGRILAAAAAAAAARAAGSSAPSTSIQHHQRSILSAPG